MSRWHLQWWRLLNSQRQTEMWEWEQHSRIQLGHSFSSQGSWDITRWVIPCVKKRCSSRSHGQNESLAPSEDMILAIISHLVAQFSFQGFRPWLLPLLGLQVLSKNGLWSGENQVSILPDSAPKFCKASFAVTAHWKISPRGFNAIGIDRRAHDDMESEQSIPQRQLRLISFSSQSHSQLIDSLHWVSKPSDARTDFISLRLTTFTVTRWDLAWNFQPSWYSPSNLPSSAPTESLVDWPTTKFLNLSGWLSW